MMMRYLLIIATLTTLSSNLSVADDHAGVSPTNVWFAQNIVFEDGQQAAFRAGLNKFMNTDMGKKMPGQAFFNWIVSNGDVPATHSFVMVFPSMKAWTDWNVEFFTAAANIIINHLNKDFPEVTRAPGPFAFSEEEYIKQILIESEFRNIKIEKVYSEISTNDPPAKDGNLLFNIGLAGRLLSEENLSEEQLSIIKNKIIEMSKKRKENGKISYKACLSYVSANKK